MNEFEKSIKLAQALWEVDSERRVQVFSFAWYKGRVIESGKNNLKTHTLNLRNWQAGIPNNRTETKGTCAELNLFVRLKKKTNIAFNKITIITLKRVKYLTIYKQKNSTH